MKSMTGCGSGSAAGWGIRVDVELSSVNRKQFDAHVNLPRALIMFESEINGIIQKFVSRGNVTGTVSIAVSGAALRKCISVEKDMAKAYVQALRAAARDCGLKDDLTARCLVNLPGVIKYENVPQDAKRIWPLLKKALLQAVGRLSQMRAREGKSLRKDLMGRFSLMIRELGGVKKEAPGVAGKYRVMLQERIARAGINGGLSSEQLAKEVALFADRCDVNEEIVRLESHFKQVSGLMNSPEPVGRTLDFLCQEMFREINTIGSKANSEAISGSVVRFKAGLESVREQVQNVE